MSRFQSYLIVAPNQILAREKTKKLAQSLGIDIEKPAIDIYFVKAAKVEIKIEQIRHLKEHIFQKPLQNMYKFVVLENAQNSTQEAQNALLKLLEEPPNHAIIVLEANNKALLLPTILSRVTTIARPVLKSGTAQSSTGLVTKTLLEKDLESAFEEIATIQNPQEFLDEQIMALSDLLVESVRKQKKSTSQIENAIEAAASAKQMISSNVNPTFVLANLVFSLNPHV